MEVHSFKSPDNDEVFEASYDGSSYNEHELNEVLSPANLDIAEDEWNLLIRTDPELAGQVGHFLLKRNKSLEMLINTTEQCSEEHKIRANHYEKQITHMRQTMDQQTRTLETFERQVHELSVSYEKMADDCRQYRERNKSLWEVVATLEEKCEEYLGELELLKSSRPFQSKDSPCSEDVLSPISPLTDEEVAIVGGGFDEDRETRNEDRESDIISLKLYAEETDRKHDIERCQRLNAEVKLQRACAENEDLRNHIKFLEHRIKEDQRDAGNNNKTNNNNNNNKLEAKCRSRSLNSLCEIKEDDVKNIDSNDNNIQYEVDQLQSNSNNPNSSIRDLILRFDDTDTTDGGHNNERRGSSAARSPLCSACKNTITTSSPRKEVIRDIGSGGGMGHNSMATRVVEKRPSINDTSSSTTFSTTHISAAINTGVRAAATPSPAATLAPPVGVTSSTTISPTVDNYRDMFAEIFEKLKISRPGVAAM